MFKVKVFHSFIFSIHLQQRPICTTPCQSFKKCHGLQMTFIFQMKTLLMFAKSWSTKGCAWYWISEYWWFTSPRNIKLKGRQVGREVSDCKLTCLITDAQVFCPNRCSDTPEEAYQIICVNYIFLAILLQFIIFWQIETMTTTKCYNS